MKTTIIATIALLMSFLNLFFLVELSSNVTEFMTLQDQLNEQQVEVNKTASAFNKSILVVLENLIKEYEIR